MQFAGMKSGINMELKSYQLVKKIKQNCQSFWEADAYLFLGEESFLKEDLLNFVIKQLHISKDSIVRLDAATMESHEILITLNTKHLSDDRILIIVQNADKIDAPTCQRLYEIWDENGCPQEVLPIFIATKVTNRKLWFLIKEEGLWCKFYKMFSDSVPKWTKEKLNFFGVKATQGTEYILSNLCDLNLRQIVKEIEKLALLDETLTPESVQLYIRGQNKIDRFMLDDKFVIRDLISLQKMLSQYINHTSASVKEVIASFVKLTRHAIQALYYIEQNEVFAGQLVGLAGQLVTLTDGDWKTISQKIEISKTASGIINGIPMLKKMYWTGNLPFTVEKVTDDKPKKAKGKRHKALSFDFDKDNKQRKQDEILAKRKWEESELYNHNIWYQTNNYGILKAFHMASVYTKTELEQMLLQMLKIYQNIHTQGEFLMQERFDCFLGSLSAGLLQIQDKS